MRWVIGGIAVLIVAVVVYQKFGDDGFGFCGRGIGIEQILIADDEHSFRQARDFFIGALDSFDDHGAGCAAEDLSFAEAVNVRVILVEAGRFVFRNAKLIFKWRIAWLDGSFQDVVLMAGGGDC